MDNAKGGEEEGGTERTENQRGCKYGEEKGRRKEMRMIPHQWLG